MNKLMNILLAILRRRTFKVALVDGQRVLELGLYE